MASVLLSLFIELALLRQGYEGHIFFKAMAKIKIFYGGARRPSTSSG